MPQLFRDLSVSAVAAGFLAVLVSYAGLGDFLPGRGGGGFRRR